MRNLHYLTNFPLFSVCVCVCCVFCGAVHMTMEVRGCRVQESSSIASLTALGQSLSLNQRFAVSARLADRLDPWSPPVQDLPCARLRIYSL